MNRPIWHLRACHTCHGDVTWDPLFEDYRCILCGRVWTPPQPKGRAA